MYSLDFRFSEIQELTTVENRGVFLLSHGELLALEQKIQSIKSSYIRIIGKNTVEFMGTSVRLPTKLFEILSVVSEVRSISIDSLNSVIWGGFLDFDSLKTYLRRLRKIFRDAGVPIPLKMKTVGGERFIYLDD